MLLQKIIETPGKIHLNLKFEIKKWYLQQALFYRSSDHYVEFNSNQQHCGRAADPTKLHVPKVQNALHLSTDTTDGFIYYTQYKRY